MKELVEKVKRFLGGRAQAYRRVFDFNNVYTDIVLEDLARFCRAHETTYNPDPRIHAALEGRKEVWLRIQHQLKLTDDQIWKLYGRKDIE